MGLFSGMLLAADFDDTLRPYGAWTVPQENLRALAYFMAEGGLFTVATGRDLCSYRGIRSHFTVNAPAVISNGAVLYDDADNRVLYEAVLDGHCREDLAVLMTQFPDAGFEVIRGTDIFTVRSSPLLEEHLREMGADTVMAAPEDIPLPWTKITLVSSGSITKSDGSCEKAAAFVREKFPGRYEAALSGSLLDIAAGGIDKAYGLRRLCEHLNILPENLICVGDGLNDIPMLMAAGRAFAPENAHPEVKAVPGIQLCGPCETCLRDVVLALSGWQPCVDFD